MAKKYLTKNEFRIDTSPEHKNPDGENHPAFITGRQGHTMYANDITHSRSIRGVHTIDIGENPNKLSKDKRRTRISTPYRQKDTQFSKNTLSNFRFSNETRKKIKAINKKLGKFTYEDIAQLNSYIDYLAEKYK